MKSLFYIFEGVHSTTEEKGEGGEGDIKNVRSLRHCLQAQSKEFVWLNTWRTELQRKMVESAGCDCGWGIDGISMM